MRQKEKGNRIFHIKGSCHIKRQEGFLFWREKGEKIFWEEQRDPHGEGSHLNASKADFFYFIIQVSF